MFAGIYFIFSALCSLHLINAATKADDNSTIVLPRVTRDLTNGVTLEVPEECKNQNYCTIKPKDYPQDLFNELLKGKFKVPPATYLMEDDLSGRRESRDDCDTTVTYEEVFQIKTEDSWRTVVQAPEENYVQKIRMESCNRHGFSCFEGYKALGLQTLCVQKFSPWEFRIHDGHEHFEKVTVTLPTCCSCRYKRVD